MGKPAATEKYRSVIEDVVEQMEEAIARGEPGTVAGFVRAAGASNTDWQNARTRLLRTEPTSPPMLRLAAAFKALRELGPVARALPHQRALGAEPKPAPAPPQEAPPPADEAPWDLGFDDAPPPAPAPRAVVALVPEEFDDKMAIYDDVQLVISEALCDEEEACQAAGVAVGVYLACKQAVLAYEARAAEQRRLDGKTAKTVEWEGAIERGMEKAVLKVKEGLIRGEAAAKPAFDPAAAYLPQPLPAMPDGAMGEELVAHYRICAVMATLSPEQQRRVVTSVAVMFGLEGAFFLLEAAANPKD